MTGASVEGGGRGKVVYVSSAAVELTVWFDASTESAPRKGGSCAVSSWLPRADGATEWRSTDDVLNTDLVLHFVPVIGQTLVTYHHIPLYTIIYHDAKLPGVDL